MSTEDLAEAVCILTGIPFLHMRLVHGEQVLRPKRSVLSCGLSPLAAQIHVLRSSEYPENPVIPWGVLKEVLPTKQWPSDTAGWIAVQDLVWPGFPSLKPGWFRCLS